MIINLFLKSRKRNAIKILFPVILVIEILQTVDIQGGEFVLMDTVITYSSSENAFSHLIKDYDAYPANWLSPDDYFHGMIYTYYEVVSVPTNEPFYLQFDIFQYYPSRAEWDFYSEAELCEDIRTLGGIGSIAQNGSSPSEWWASSHPIDFSRVYDFLGFGTVLWGSNPASPLNPSNGGGNDITWSQRAKWLPCTIRVVAVAVSAGSVFSGWDRYLGEISTHDTNPDSEAISIYPNPIRNGVAFLRADAGLQHSIGIYSASGILLQTAELRPGEQQIKINCPRKGLYICKIASTKTTRIQKIIIE